MSGIGSKSKRILFNFFISLTTYIVSSLTLFLSPFLSQCDVVSNVKKIVSFMCYCCCCRCCVLILLEQDKNF